MKKLKVTMAILVVLFACQAAFAGFVPVSKAEAKVVQPLAASVEILQRMSIGQKDAVAFYAGMANASDAQIEKIFAQYGFGRGLVGDATIGELEAIFVRGVEECSDYNAFRRAAFHLAVKAAKVDYGKGFEDKTAKIDSAEEKFAIVGYDYIFRLKGNTVVFKFIDAVGKKDIPVIANALMAVVPGAKSFSNPTYGEIDIETSGLTEYQFKSFVTFAEGLIYNTIY